jgi:TP901 family phage tail tape measure protein
LVTAAQLVGRVAIEQDDTAKTKLLAVGKVVDKVQDALSTKLVQATQKAGDASKQLGATVAKTSTTMASFGSLVPPQIAKVGQSIGQLGTTIKTKLEPVSQAFTSFRDKIKESTDNVSNTIKTRFTSMTAPIVNFGGRVRTAAQPLVDFGSRVKDSLSPLGNFASHVGEAGKSLAGMALNTLKAVNPISALGSRIKESSSNMFNLGQTVGKAVFSVQTLGIAVAGIGAAIGSTIPKAMAFESTLTKINVLAGLSKKEVSAASEAMLQMSVKVGKGPQDLAEGLYYIASAGYDAKTSMLILEQSAKQAAVGMTSTQTVANAATAALKAFPALSVAKAFDIMTKTVSTGKTEWADYAGVVGQVALNASAAGISFEEANAAFAVLTNSLGSSAETETALSSLLQVSKNVGQLTDNATKLGLSFDANKYKSLGFIEKMKYLDEVTKGNKESMTELLGREEAMSALNGLLINGANDYSKALVSITGSAGAADKAFEETAKNASLAWDRAKASVDVLALRIGVALLPVVNTFNNNIVPMITNMAAWVTQNQIVQKSVDAIGVAFNTISGALQTGTTWLSNFTGGAGAATPILIGLGAILAAMAVSALSLAAGMIVAAAPFVAIGVAVAGLTAIFMHFYNTNAGFKSFIDGMVQSISTGFIPTMQLLGNVIQTYVWPVLQGIGSFLATTFKPVWDNLVATIQQQLIPAWNQLMVALQPAIPFFQLIGAIILGIIVFALGVFIATIAGLAGAIAGALPGLMQFFGGLVQVVTGFITIFLSIIGFFVHLFTGQFDKLGGDLANIWNGIVQIFWGALNMIGGFFRAAWGLISGYVVGFVTTIISYFMGLYNALVGHSIIPDMINGIVSWFAQLPGRVFGFLASLVSGAISRAGQLVSGFIGQVAQLPGRVAGALSGVPGAVTSALANAAASALRGGANIVNQIAQGIRNAIGAVGSAISAVTNFISSHLPHSPAKLGPLRDLLKQGKEISNQVAQGMLAGMPKLDMALDQLLKPISVDLSAAGNLPASGTTGPVMPASFRSGPVYVSVSAPDIFLDGQKLTNSVMSRGVKAARSSGPIRSS